MEIELESPKQLASRVGWPVSRIRKLVSKEQLRHYRFGKNILIPPDAIAEYMARVEVKPESGGLEDAE